MKKVWSQFVIVLCGLTLAQNVYSGETHDVSLIQLIANPERYNGQDVRIIGFLHLEFEDEAVYLHREDFEKSIQQNGIAIRLSDSQLRSWRKLNNRYVLIEGRFSSGDKGHLDAMSGSLQNIVRLSDWSVNRMRSNSLGK